MNRIFGLKKTNFLEGNFLNLLFLAQLEKKQISVSLAITGKSDRKNAK